MSSFIVGFEAGEAKSAERLAAAHSIIRRKIDGWYATLNPDRDEQSYWRPSVVLPLGPEVGKDWEPLTEAERFEIEAAMEGTDSPFWQLIEKSRKDVPS